VSDFTTINCQYNTGTNAAPTWTGTALAFGGSNGANELRFAPSSGASGSTGSAAWPYFSRPASSQTVPQLWAFTADTTGNQVNYDGTNTPYLQLRWNWDNLGTFVSAPQFTAFGDTTHTAPSAGTQPGSQSGSPIVNGSSDTSNTSYYKANAYGFGVDTSGTQQTPAAAPGTAAVVNSGTAGASTTATNAWLASFQSLQGWIQYIANGAIPKSLTAGFWYWVFILFVGPNMSTGTLLPCITFQYNYA
jgi:hypothetical protein